MPEDTLAPERRHAADRVTRDVPFGVAGAESLGLFPIPRPRGACHVACQTSSDDIAGAASTIDTHATAVEGTACDGEVTVGDGAPPGGAETSEELSADRFPRWCRRYAAILIATDFVIGASHGALAAEITYDSLTASAASAVLGGLCWIAVIGIARGYDRTRLGIGSDEIRSVVRAGVGGLAVAALLGAAIAFGVDRVVIMAFPSAVLFSVAVRYGLRKVLHGRRANGRGVRRVVVVGDERAASALAERFDSEPHFGMRPVGAVIPRQGAAGESGDRLLPVEGLDRVVSAIGEWEADAVAVAPGTDPSFLRALAWALEGSHIDLLVDPGLVEVAGPRLHIRPFEGLPLLHVEEPRFSGGTRVIKAVTDRLLAVLIALLVLPLCVGVAVAIKCEDRGPVFFRQTRVGKGGRHFAMWKFRSMQTDAERRRRELQDSTVGAGMLFKLRDDPRVTRVGRVIRKYSIDELPQLINVLIGHMSLVGPRPPLPCEVELYQRPAHRRLLVTPGLTGLWQISGRSDLSWEESIRLDLRYVENWTFTSDLMILWKTLFAVVGRRGAY